MTGRGRRVHATAVLALAATIALAAPGPGPDSARADESDCLGFLPGQELPEPEPGEGRLRFGIYPGGAAGQIGPPAPAEPEVPHKRIQALKELRGGSRPFFTHLYLNYRNPRQANRLLDELVEEGRRYARSEFRLEYVVTYRPDEEGGDVEGFLTYVREVVRRLSRIERFKELQVTNEVNQTMAPDSSDGAFPGARRALVEGVPAARRALDREGREDVEVGFNWFYRTDPGSEQDFWEYIDREGGERFHEALDWVGLDAYPGTFFPPVTSDFRSSMVNAMHVLRRCYMPIGDIDDEVPIHVTENGYPTGPGRAESTQAQALEEMVRAVHDYRGSYNVTDYRWFDLRDGDSESPSFGQHYGLMRDDYSPKPAFGVYRRLVERLAR